MLNMAKVELEFIPDSDMYLFFEKDMKGWEFCIFPIDVAKPKLSIFKSCDPKQESKHITYLDPNNLYGYGISEFLQTSRLKWIDPKEFDMNKYNSNS